MSLKIQAQLLAVLHAISQSVPAVLPPVSETPKLEDDTLTTVASIY
jgi:hypothetical protein